MRLNYLWIENYKNLKDITINFEKGNGLAMLIGANGSGKSNILEAISKIFAGAYRGKRANVLGCDFLLCYSIYENVSYIAGRKEKCIAANIFTENDGKKESAFVAIDGGAMPVIEFIFSKRKRLSVGDMPIFINRSLRTDEHLPSSVIAIYSGEETRLWNEVYKSAYSGFISKARKGVSDNSFRMVYIDKNHWIIALFILWLSSTPSNEQFLSEQIGITQIDKIDIETNRNQLDIESNPLLTSFIDRLLPNGESVASVSSSEVFERLCTGEVATVMGNIERGEDGITMPIQIRHAPYTGVRQIFQFLVQGLLGTKPIIKKFDITFDGALETPSLSEGEKKLLLIKCGLDIAANENSILLLDEPDSHVHEVRKKYMLDVFRDYSEHGRQIVVTTHSPTLANLYNSEGRIMLERNEDGGTRQIPFENVRAVEQLTDGIWSAVEQNIFFSSNKPLILTEGKGDIAYIKKAIDILKSEENGYEKIDCDFLNMGGGSDPTEFINHLKPHINSQKKVIVIFDRDEAGSQGIYKCIGQGRDRGHDFEVYEEDNWYYFMLPKSEGHSHIDFMIEDYFPKEHKMKIIEDMNRDADGQMNKYPKDNREYLKKNLASTESFVSYTPSIISGFGVLLDVLVDIIDGAYAIDN